jgi:stringent starvation protein B
MSDPPRQLPPKKDVALALLEGPSLFVHLDPRSEGVQVPKWFTGQPQLVLQVGLNMAIPIDDLKVDDDGITCTLSFNRAPFWCRLPWSAVYALVGEDGRGMVWPEDVPPEVAQQMQKQQQEPPPSKQPGGKKPRGKLTSIGGGGGGGGGGDEGARQGKPRPRPVAVAAVRDDGTEEEVPEPADDGNAALKRPETPAPPAVRSIARAKDEPARPQPGKPGEAGKKPRRELPPYLRVIK